VNCVGLTEHHLLLTRFDGKTVWSGNSWDSFVPGPEIWKEVYRVMKPGAHLLAFTGSRTMDLMGFSIRFAGFEMRDTIMAWLYGTGKPKSNDVGKGIDAYFGAEREIVTHRMARGGGFHIRSGSDDLTEQNVTAPATPEAKFWDGWNAALKPGFEPVLVARKPLDQDTVAENILVHGTGAMNIGACRLPPDPETGARKWPMNAVFAHHPACEEDGPCHESCAVRELAKQEPGCERFFPQFYYNGKAGKDDRYVVVECACAEQQVLPLVEAYKLVEERPATHQHRPTAHAAVGVCPKCDNPYIFDRHPTVKPTNVMRWLVRLVTPVGGKVLDPFNGSGSTGVGCMHERLRYVGIEMGDKYFAIASARLTDTAEDTPPYEPPEPLRGIDEPAVPETAEVVPLPDSEALRKAFDLTEEIKVERKPGGLASKDFKRLVAKSLKR
jgi:site-specific DNA-methyltransferase (adenine-specific)